MALTTYTAASTVYDQPWSPRVTLSRDTFGKLTAVIEVDGLLPTRSTSADERAAGISSLDPPTVSAIAKTDRRKTIRTLIDGAIRAVCASAVASGVTLAPGEMAQVCIRVGSAIRIALRAIDEAI